MAKWLFQLSKFWKLSDVEIWQDDLDLKLFAAMNEVLRHIYNQANGKLDTWIALKLWLFMPLSFLFTFTQMPMLLRHGLGEDSE